MPLGPGLPLDDARQQAQRWFPYWWSREVVRFLDDLFESDRDFREILTGRQTFVNGPLAQFYRSIQRGNCCGPEAAFGMNEESASPITTRAPHRRPAHGCRTSSPFSPAPVPRVTHPAALRVSTYRPLKRGAPSVSGSAVVDREPTASPPTQVAREPAGLQSEPIDATRLGGDPIAGPAPAAEAQPPDRYAPERSRTREQLLAMRDEIAAFLAELERSVR